MVAGWSLRLPPGVRGESLALLDDSLAVLREFPVLEVESNGGDGWGLTLPHSPEYEWALSGNRILAWGLSDEYRIDFFDRDGEWNDTA